jgi:hypothetical protein
MPQFVRVMNGGSGKMRKTIGCTHYPKNCEFTNDSAKVVREHEKKEHS